MKKPKMVIFDYGQTLVNETHYDEIKGISAVLKVSKNPNNVTPQEIQELEGKVWGEIGKGMKTFNNEAILEVHSYYFVKYVYEYLGVEFTKSDYEREKIFENAAFISQPTKHIEEFLKFLDDEKIRTSVISNISFSESLLKDRIKRYVPSNKFEFILASSEYVFRKPSKMIFELALKKANLDPSDVWYCGDNAVFDVDGAANCGMFPVWYKGALQAANKSVTKTKRLDINDWYEAIDLIRKL